MKKPARVIALLYFSLLEGTKKPRRAEPSGAVNLWELFSLGKFTIDIVLLTVYIPYFRAGIRACPIPLFVLNKLGQIVLCVESQLMLVAALLT